jgi:hypothetical protein
MNGELLILFVIILLALVLCSVLGGNNCREGFTEGEHTMAFTSQNGSTAVIVTSSDGNSKAVVTNADGTTTTYTKTETKEGPYGSSVLYSEPNGGTATLSTAKS